MQTSPDLQARAPVVTGLGVTSVLGTDVETFWSRLNDGGCGYGPQPRLLQKNTPFKVGGCLGELRPEHGFAPEFAQYDRATRLALHAAAQAARQARLDAAQDAARVGVVMGTTCGANDAIETEAFEAHWFADRIAACPDQAFALYDHSEIAHAIARVHGFEGPSYLVGTACSSGKHAVGEAIDLIRSGQADVVLCGGADAFTLLPVFGFYAMKSLAAAHCTPFARDREGMILGEGAAVLVVESAARAAARGVPALARLDGWALNCDAKNFAAPLESGERCKDLILDCADRAGLPLHAIDYINAHGTGTSTNDAMEARGIAWAYRDAAAAAGSAAAGNAAGNADTDAVADTAAADRGVPLSSIKGLLGHTLGAAGAFEAVAATLAVQRDCIPPNTPVAALDAGAALNVVTASTRTPLQHVLSLSFAFGGCNVATLFSKAQPHDARGARA